MSLKDTRISATPKSSSNSSRPLVSIVIPAHNEAHLVGGCITSVFANDWPRDQLEVFVIDHQSSDATATIAQAAGARVIHQTRDKKIGAIRNAGLNAARGEFVAYVDADCTVPQTWLRSAITILGSHSDVGAVGGPCLSPSDGTWVEKCLALTHVIPGTAKPVTALATSSFIAPTKLLLDIGKFNEIVYSGEDDDISNRIRQRGLTLVSASDCHIVHHGYPRTLSAVAKKEMWHGSNHIDVRSKFDLILILTFIFLISALSTIPMLMYAFFRPSQLAFDAVYALGLLHFTPPLLYVLKRVRQDPTDWRLALPTLAVGYAYFIGHSIGVIDNLWRRLTAIAAWSS